MATSRRQSTENIFRQSKSDNIKPLIKSSEAPELNSESDVKIDDAKEEKMAVLPVTTMEIPEKPVNKVDDLFKNSKKQRGVQKTVYFEKPIWDQIEAISNKYKMPYSEVVNKLLSNYIE